MDILNGKNKNMTAKQILQSVKLDPNSWLIPIMLEEAVERLLEFIKDWELTIRVDDISKDGWEILLGSYGDAIINYHPDNDHQERIVFLKNEKILKKYGLMGEDIKRLDFI